MQEKKLDLFGGDAPWKVSDWTASDDRVRGGKSQSYLGVSHAGTMATFEGTLDIKTLGGAGFASQRTAADDASWDLSGYDGLEIVVAVADGKRYTLNVKDELLPRDPDTGREQSTISYEYDFSISSGPRKEAQATLWVPWSQLNATYRGRGKKEAPGLKTGNVRRFGLMCRSFFGDQEGDFELVVVRITAVKRSEEECDGARATETEISTTGDRKGSGRGFVEHGHDLEKADRIDESVRSTRTVAYEWSKFILTTGVMLASAWFVVRGYPHILLKAREWLTRNV